MFEQAGSRGEFGYSSLRGRLIGYIKNSGLVAGDHLREQDLADRLGVSRTPVRRMLAALRDAGIVEWRPNKGYFLITSSGDLFEPAIEMPVTDAAALFDRIVGDRLGGFLASEFRAGELASRYAVSQRLSNKVLRDLQAEGVVEAHGRGRFRFNPALLTPEASDASYAFRLAIEPEIPLLEGFSISCGVLARARDLHDAFLAMPIGERTNRMAYRIDADFHEMIAEASGNFYFHSAVVQQNRLRQLMEYRDYNNMRRVQTWCHEHLAIIAALEADDLRKASRLIRTHLQNAMAFRPRVAASHAHRSRTGMPQS